MKKILLLVLIGIVFLAVALGTTYNQLVTRSQAVDNQWAQVETQYQRRFDLIPNLVESVKGIFQQEKDVFTAIAEARTRYSGATTVNDKAEAATQLETGLGRLLAVIENYPELKSSATVQQLMDELAGTENRVSVERKRYNDQVQAYNTYIKRFPTNLVAKVFGFGDRAYFQAEAGAEQAPKVKF